MANEVANYQIRHGVRHDTCRIFVWDPIQKKQVFRSVAIPAELKGKKLTAFCLKQVEEFQNQVQYRTSVSPSNTSFGEFFCGEWSEYKCSQGRDLTLKEYRNLYDVHLSSSLGPVPLDRITPRLLDSIYKERAERGVSKDRVARLHKLISQVLEDAKRRGIINENVARNRMEGPPKPEKRAQYDERVLSEDEVHTIINAVNEMKDPFWRTLFLLAISRGIRREEIAALRWERLLELDYDLKIEQAVRISRGEGLRIKQPKSATSKRIMPKTDAVKMLLQQWHQTCGCPTEGYVFPSPVNMGQPLYPDTISRHAMKLSRRLEIPFTFHTFRHIYVSMSITLVGSDPRTVQSLSGHSDPRVTMGIYARASTDSLSKAEERFEKHFNIIRTVKPQELNEADENFSLVAYVKSHGPTMTKVLQIPSQNSN